MRKWRETTQNNSPKASSRCSVESKCILPKKLQNGFRYSLYSLSFRRQKPQAKLEASEPSHNCTLRDRWCNGLVTSTIRRTRFGSQIFMEIDRSWNRAGLSTPKVFVQVIVVVFG